MTHRERHEFDWECDSCHRTVTVDDERPECWVSVLAADTEWDLCDVCYPLVMAGVERIREVVGPKVLR